MLSKKEHINTHIYIRDNVKEKRLEFFLVKFHQSFSTNARQSWQIPNEQKNIY